MGSDRKTPLSLGSEDKKRPTINDVARLAGVSKKTVSRVINASPAVSEDTRNRVSKVMAELSYAPDPTARGLALRHSFLIGMIYNNPNPQYVVSMQEGMLTAIADTEFELAVHRCDRESEHFVRDARRFIERQKLFGVVLTPSSSEDERLADMLRDTGCAFVRVASIPLDEPQYSFVSNDRMGAFKAARHLTEIGHRRIAMVTGRSGFRSSEERIGGFEQGLAEAGVELASEGMIEGDYTFDSGVRAGHTLAAMSPRPTAVFASNDQMAAGLLHGLRKNGLEAPRDVSVIGYDDLQVAIVSSPQLTTIHSPTRDIGRFAAQKLLASKGFCDPPMQETTEPHLVVRESTGRPPTDL